MGVAQVCKEIMVNIEIQFRCLVPNIAFIVVGVLKSKDNLIIWNIKELQHCYGIQGTKENQDFIINVKNFARSISDEVCTI